MLKSTEELLKELGNIEYKFILNMDKRKKEIQEKISLMDLRIEEMKRGRK